MSNYFRSLLTRYHQNTASQKERWLVEQYFERLQRDGVRPEEIEQDLRLKNRLAKKIFNRTIHTPSKRRWLPPSVAASLLIGIGILSLYLNRSPEWVTLSTNSQEQQKIYLPDSSIVYLNSNSHLSYPDTFDEDKREVRLTGEAYFKVREDIQPFIVKSPSLITKVLGTTFNVNNHPDKLPAVTVSSGKVEVVAINGGQKTILEKNQQAVLQHNRVDLLSKTVSAKAYTDWHLEKIHFHRASISEVVDHLSSRFDTNITLKTAPDSNCTISGNFSSGSLEDILKSIEFIHDIQYFHLEDGSIEVYTFCSHSP